MSHNHGHSCGSEHCSHGADDDHLKQGEGQQDLLYSAIDRERIVALNESVQGSASKIVKPYDQRMDEEVWLESDADDQLIITIPFTGQAKLRSLLLKAGPSDMTPQAIHLYSNVDSLDFSDANDGTPPPAQKLESIAQTREVVEYPLRPTKFPNVSSLTLFVPASEGGDKTRIYFLGFRGEFRQTRREGPTNIVYESAPQVKDHAKIPGLDNTNSHSFGPGS